MLCLFTSAQCLCSRAQFHACSGAGHRAIHTRLIVAASVRLARNGSLLSGCHGYLWTARIMAVWMVYAARMAAAFIMHVVHHVAANMLEGSDVWPCCTMHCSCLLMPRTCAGERPCVHASTTSHVDIDMFLLCVGPCSGFIPGVQLARFT